MQASWSSAPVTFSESVQLKGLVWNRKGQEKNDATSQYSKYS